MNSGKILVLFPKTLSVRCHYKRESITCFSTFGEREMMEALDAASIRKFVESLPDGINTQIGERGIRLSMGEKQRITLARARKIFSYNDFDEGYFECRC